MGTGGYFGYRRVFWVPEGIFCVFVLVPEGILGTRGYFGYQRVFWVPDGILGICIFFLPEGFFGILLFVWYQRVF